MADLWLCMWLSKHALELTRKYWTCLSVMVLFVYVYVYTFRLHNNLQSFFTRVYSAHSYDFEIFVRYVLFNGFVCRLHNTM